MSDGHGWKVMPAKYKKNIKTQQTCCDDVQDVFYKLIPLLVGFYTVICI